MEKYRDTGLKLTPQRLAIFECLDGNREHPSADDIYRQVKEKFPTMSFATVYNTLEVLRERGGLLELTIDPDRKRYDPNTEHHHHLICLKCKKVVDVHADYDVDVPGGQRDGFKIMGNHVEFYGTCSNCK